MAARIQSIHLSLLSKARAIFNECLSFSVCLSELELALTFDKYEKNVNEIKEIIEEIKTEVSTVIREI